jgi:predicted HAD superfamily Cof-like phosphohydrolase
METNNDWLNRACALEAQLDLLNKEIEILSKSNFDMVKEFHRTFNKEPDPPKPTLPSPENTVLRMKLMCEELQETLHELGYSVTFDITPVADFSSSEPLDLAKVAKELADLLYVTYGTAASLGIDIDEVFAEVHRSNMSKVGPDGVPMYREDGKVLKGPNYTPPNIVLEEPYAASAQKPSPNRTP